MLHQGITDAEILAAEMSRVDDRLRAVALQPTTRLRAPLVIDQLRMMKLKNMGFPMHMYHERLDMRVANSQDMYDALIAAGYQETYIHKTHPKMLYRRNFAPEFAGADGEYIESRLARTPADQVALMKAPHRKTQSDWCESLAQLPPLPDAPEESPEVVIARLQAQLAAKDEIIGLQERQNSGEMKRGPGRPPKDKDAETV